MDLIVASPSVRSFTGDRVELQELLGTVRAGLDFECPGVKEIAIRGVVDGKTIYRGNVKARDRWILRTVQPVRILKPKNATPAPTRPPLPKPDPQGTKTAVAKPPEPAVPKLAAPKPAAPRPEPDPPVEREKKWYDEGVAAGKAIGAASVCGMPRPETKNRVIGARDWAVREGASPSQHTEFGRGMGDGLMYVSEHGHDGSCQNALEMARTQQALRE